MKQKPFEDDRVPERAKWFETIPTTQKPRGYVEVGVNWSNGWVTMVCDDNDEVCAWAQDLTPQQARWLGDALLRLADVAENANPE